MHLQDARGNASRFQIMPKLTVPEYASQVQVDQSTVYRQIKAGRLKSEQIDGVLHVLVEPPEDAKDNGTLLARLQDEVEYLRKELDTRNEQLALLQKELAETRQSHDSIIQQMQADTESAKERSDTIVLQLTQQVDKITQQNQALTQETRLLLEDSRPKRRFWKRLFAWNGG